MARARVVVPERLRRRRSITQKLFSLDRRPRRFHNAAPVVHVRPDPCRGVIRQVSAVQVNLAVPVGDRSATCRVVVRQLAVVKLLST